MQQISFAWTRRALDAGRKTVTRREWDRKYAQQFYVGQQLAAMTRSPRRKGKQFATIKIAALYWEHVADCEDAAEYEAEGLRFMEDEGYYVDGQPALIFWRALRQRNPEVFVIRFTPCAVTEQTAFEL